jgi:hypothetical protein
VRTVVGIDSDAVRQERLDRFIAENRVERLSHSYEVISDLLRQGGAPEDQIRDHLVICWSADSSARRLNNAIALGGPFDHIEVWGRGGTPLFLIGHPYQLEPEAARTLESMCRLGMDVVIHSRSWYRNPSTIQVMVCHPPTVARVRGG